MPTTPLEMPLPFPCRARKFDLIYRQDITASGAGYIQTYDRTTPMWMAEYTTPPLNILARYQPMRAFLDGLDGAKGTFLAFDPRRPMPYNYRTAAHGSNPLGTVTVVFYDPTNGVITLAGPASTTGFTYGDYINVKVGNAYWLFRIRSTANFAGNGQATYTIRPLPAINITAGTVVRYQRACAEMKVIGGIKEDDSVDSLPVLTWTSYQFVGK